MVLLTRSMSKLTKPPAKPPDNVFTSSSVVETPIDPTDSSPSSSISITQKIAAANMRIPIIDTPNASFIPDPFSSVDSSTRSLPTCSACRIKGHKRNQAVCPNYGSSSTLSTDASVDVNLNSTELNEIKCNPKVTSSSLQVCSCCGIGFPKNRRGKTASMCIGCKCKDSFNPPILIPQEIHPSRSNEFAFVFKRFLDELIGGNYRIHLIWEFFASFCPIIDKNEVPINVSSVSSVPVTPPSNEKLSFQLEEQCLNNQWSRALDSLEPGIKAPKNALTLEKLRLLHPYEDAFEVNHELEYWKNNPLTPSEVAQVIKKRPRGKAAGLSGLSIDHVKAAIIALDDCLELLTLFFNKTLTGQLKYNEELKRSRLTALVKNAKMDVRPIAVSECLHVILSACCLSRFNNRCKSSLFPFQYGISTTDGVASAVFASDIFLHHSSDKVCMFLDFSNAFNSVKRSSIYYSLQKLMPELLPYFKLS
ncbi:hypothetical protein RCL1_004963 [Eukaryota sp. TZLM3-RCL]